MTQVKGWLDKCHGPSFPSHTPVNKWYAGFKLGRTSTVDVECSGHPNEAVTEENVKNVHRIVLNH